MSTRRNINASFGSCSRPAIQLRWIFVLAVSACAGQIEDTGGGGGPDAGTSRLGVDARPAPDDPETACDDQLDNDGDGTFDCDDPDCADEAHCGWPRAMQINIELSFDASALAKLAGYDDCVTRVEASVADVGEASCPACDRGYNGPYVYAVDTCPAAPRPAEGAYGVRFVSATQREIHVRDEADVWQLVGMATGADGVFSLVRADPVDYEGSDAGDMTTTMEITDL